MRLLLVIVICSISFFLQSCGSSGSGNGGSNSVDNGPSLTTAKSFDEYLSVLQLYSNDSLGVPSTSEIQRYYNYDHKLSDFNNLANRAGITNPLDGRYEQYSIPYWDVAASGYLKYKPVNDSTSNATALNNAIDNLALDGQTVLFYGVKNTVSDSSGDKIPVLILTEGIVYSSGEPAYKSLNVLEGYFYEHDIPGGPTFDGLPGSLIKGHYQQYAVENYAGGQFQPLINGVPSGNIVTTGLILEYDAYQIRYDNSNTVASDESSDETNAVEIPLGSSISGKLLPVGDVDYYYYVAPAQGTINITSNDPIMVSVDDENGSFLGESTSGEPVNLNIANYNGGKFYIYVFSADFIVTPYKVSVNFSAGYQPDGNESFDQAILYDTVSDWIPCCRGRYDYPGDEDYYLVKVPPGYSKFAANVSVGGLPTDCYLYNTSKVLLASDTSSNGPACSFILSPGTYYYVKIKSPSVQDVGYYFFEFE